MRERKGVMGSSPGSTIRAISRSRTMKFVALVSSSMRRREVLASMASDTAAAWEVEPLASSVEKRVVSAPFGRFRMKREISLFFMARPSSARIFMASREVITSSLPSPAIWLYTPRSSACIPLPYHALRYWRASAVSPPSQGTKL